MFYFVSGTMKPVGLKIKNKHLWALNVILKVRESC